MPPLYALEAANAWQTGVTFINRHRFKQEVECRVEMDARLSTLFKSGRRKTAFIGVCLKICTAGVGLGLDDLCSVADAFIKL